MTRLGRAFDWAFRNRITGRITVGQWPNAPLWLFIALSAAGWMFDPPGRIGLGVRIAALTSLAWWAVDEMVRGVNPWRRCLGAVILAGEVVTVAAAMSGASAFAR